MRLTGRDGGRIAVCSIAATMLVSGCGKTKESGQQTAVPVSVERAKQENVPRYLDALGIAVSMDSVNIVPQVHGELVEIHFVQGSRVETGQPLFTIDPRQYEAKVLEAKGRLERARAELEIRKLKLLRNTDLAQKDFISKQHYDQYAAEVAEAAAGVESSEGALAKADFDLENCRITAPTDGVVSLYKIDVGNIVGPASAPLATIEQIDPIYADFAIPGRKLGAVRSYLARAAGALPAIIRPLDNEEPERLATVAFVDNVIAGSTGTVTLRGTFENADAAFWPGQPLRVRLLLEELHDAVLVPHTAVGTGQAGSYVFVVNDKNAAKQRSVRLGQPIGDAVVIENGVQPGEQVVTSGRLRLSDGARVKIAPPPTPSSQQPATE